MNSITLQGHVAKDAVVNLVKNNGIETPLVTFSFIDMGLPYQKNEPMYIEVHFMKEAAMHIVKYLRKGKEITVMGCLRSKIYITQSGEQKQKYFVSADFITLSGAAPKKDE
jgi:single-stranded DNA-binding protein